MAVILELEENLFGLCLSYLDIVENNWLLNLPREEVQPILFEKWKKDTNINVEISKDYDGSKKWTVLIDHKVRAVITNSGKWYYRDGYHHRDGGPAVIDNDGCQEWYQCGMLHREDGPAVIDNRDHRDYQAWYINGKLHRVDGPAVIRGDIEEWFFHDQLHRVDGPAVTSSNGYKSWWQNNKRHRVGGPAVIDPSCGIQEWWENDQMIKSAPLNSS